MILGYAESITCLELMGYRESLPFGLSRNHFKTFQIISKSLLERHASVRRGCDGQVGRPPRCICPLGCDIFRASPASGRGYHYRLRSAGFARVTPSLVPSYATSECLRKRPEPGSPRATSV